MSHEPIPANLVHPRMESPKFVGDPCSPPAALNCHSFNPKTSFSKSTLREKCVITFPRTVIPLILHEYNMSIAAETLAPQMDGLRTEPLPPFLPLLCSLCSPLASLHRTHTLSRCPSSPLPPLRLHRRHHLAVFCSCQKMLSCLQAQENAPRRYGKRAPPKKTDQP